MFIDLNEIDSGTNLTFDLCIIGAGAAGISLAHRFHKKNISVALLESGGLELDPAIQDLNAGTNTGLTYYPLISTRLRYFGGTTNHWGGQSVPLEPEDFQVRPWVPNSGWPIAYDELSRHIKSAEEICGIPCGPYRWDYWRNQIVKGKLPLDPNLFADIVLRYSDPVRRFGEVFREEIRKAANITCFLNATALQLLTDSTGETVTQVDVGSLSGNRANIKAKQFVIACGGIENSRLLLLSKNLHANGLGNQYDQVGRYFMEHPNFTSGVIRLSDSQPSALLAGPFMKVHGSRLRLDYKLHPEIQGREKLLNHTAHLRPLNKPMKTATSEDVGMMMQLWQKMQKKYEHYYGNKEKADTPDKATISDKEFTLLLRLEHAPYPDSRVELGKERDAFGQARAQLNLKIGEPEGRTIEYLRKTIAKELGRSGLGRMQLTFEQLPAGWQEQLGWQFHHSGGTRMHDSPRHGVVDRDCRVHGTHNLYVAGSSVFPTSGQGNPTLNLVALSLRLADKLESEAGI